MMNERRIRLTSCIWCAAKWVWPQPARSTRWHGGWWVFYNWQARAPQAAPERLLQGAMMATGRPRQLRWPPCRLSRPPATHPVIPPFQFARLGLAAEVPDEVIQPVHDLAQEVVPLRGDKLSSFFRDAIRREAIALAQAWSMPPASCAAAPVTVPTLLPPAPPAAPRPSPPACPTYGSVSHSGLATPLPLPHPLLEKLRTGMYVGFHSILHASKGGGVALHPEPIMHSLTTQGITLDVAMAPRFRHTRISDYLTWSQAWVVYFEATVWYHPHLLPHLAVYQVDMNRYARDYAPYVWVAFDTEFRQSVANNPGGSRDRLHSMAFHRHLCGAPPASPRPHTDSGRGGVSAPPPTRSLPTPGGPPHTSEWFGRRRGLCRDYNARSCTWATCQYEHSCTQCGGTHLAFSCPPQ